MRYIDDNRSVDVAFATRLGALAEHLGARISDERIRMYAMALDGYEPDQIDQMFRVAARTARGGFLPSVGELTGAEDAALVAWAALDRAAREVGAWVSLDLQDAAAAAAVKLVFGGWPAFCEMDDGPALAQKRTEFLAAYRAARRRETSGMVRLPGRCEAAGSYAPAQLRGKVWTAQLLITGDIIRARDLPPRALPPNDQQALTP